MRFILKILVAPLFAILVVFIWLCALILKMSAWVFGIVKHRPQVAAICLRLAKLAFNPRRKDDRETVLSVYQRNFWRRGRRALTAPWRILTKPFVLHVNRVCAECAHGQKPRPVFPGDAIRVWRAAVLEKRCGRFQLDW